MGEGKIERKYILEMAAKESLIKTKKRNSCYSLSLEGIVASLPSGYRFNTVPLLHFILFVRNIICLPVVEIIRVTLRCNEQHT